MLCHVLWRCRGRHPSLSPLRGFQQRVARRLNGSSSDIYARNLGNVEQVIAYKGFWQMLITLPRRKPFLTNVGLSVVVSSAGDLSAQYTEGNAEIDWRRCALFTAWGTASFGLVSWLVFITLYRRLFPHAIRFANLSWKQKMGDRLGQQDLVKQVAFDLLVYVPFLFYPFLYVFKAAADQGADLVTDPGRPFLQGFKAYKENFWQDNGIACLFWAPADMLVFLVPAWMRMPANTFMNYGWAGIISWLRGFKEPPVCDEAGNSLLVVGD